MARHTIAVTVRLFSISCLALLTLNRSHIVWSNFEIADLDFWRGEAYSTYFEKLDSAGGFYYERWGDAPVHSIGAALLAPRDKLHFFHDIGYRHEPFEHCPLADSHKQGKCWCSGEDNFGECPFPAKILAVAVGTCDDASIRRLPLVLMLTEIRHAVLRTCTHIPLSDYLIHENGERVYTEEASLGGAIYDNPRTLTMLRLR